MPTNFYENRAIFGDRMTKKPNKAIFDPDAKMNGASWHLGALTLTPDDLLCMNIHDKGPIYDNMPKNKPKITFWLEIQRGDKYVPPRLKDDFKKPG